MKTRVTKTEIGVTVEIDGGEIHVLSRQDCVLLRDQLGRAIGLKFSKLSEQKCRYCGNTFYARNCDVRAGHAKSCGCKKYTGRPQGDQLYKDRLWKRASTFIYLCKKRGLNVSEELADPKTLMDHIAEIGLNDKMITLKDPKKGLSKGNITEYLGKGGRKRT